MRSFVKEKDVYILFFLPFHPAAAYPGRITEDTPTRERGGAYTLRG
jgi:hypothetical protein